MTLENRQASQPAPIHEPMNRTAWAKPLDMPMAAPKMATAMTATSKTVIPSCSIRLRTPRDLTRDLFAPTVRSALAPRALGGPVGRLKAIHKVCQMLDFVNGDALGRARRGRCPGPAARHQGTAEAEFGRLAQARLAL